jgi:hypothetical protein
MKSPTHLVLVGLACTTLLAGCGSSKKDDKARPENDPAVTGALGDEIMVDPELAGQQGAAGTAELSLPPEQRTPEAIAAAKAEAADLAGGTIQSVPAASGGSEVAKLIENAATAAQIAAAAKTGKTDCAIKVQYSANWVNSLPAALSIYPQGAVQEAAGTDADGCRLRVVSYLTAVTPDDIMDFYYTRVRAGGYGAEHKVDGEDHVLGGSKGKAVYLVYARRLDNGLTEVDVVSSGS